MKQWKINTSMLSLEGKPYIKPYTHCLLLKDQVRLAVTRDLDTSMLHTIEFYFKYGCNGGPTDWPRRESVLLQYSNNGGITWKLVKELHYRNETKPRYALL